MVFDPTFYERCVEQHGFTADRKYSTGYNYMSRYVKGGNHGSRLLLWVSYENVATLGVMYKDRLTNIKSDTPGHVNCGQTPEEHAAIDNMVNAALNQIALWQLEDLNLGGN